MNVQHLCSTRFGLPVPPLSLATGLPSRIKNGDSCGGGDCLACVAEDAFFLFHNVVLD